MTDFVGFEAFFRTVDVASKADVVVAAIHWTLVLAKFRCVGTNNEAKIPPTDLLPEGWNRNQEVYTLNYASSLSHDATYVLKVVKANNTVVINLLDSSNDKVRSASINLDSHVNDDLTGFGAVKDPGALHELIANNLTRTTLSRAEKSRPRAERSEEGSSSSLPDYFGPPVAAPRRDYDDDDNPLSIGRGDLDPLGRDTAGGMLMDPNRLFRPFRQQGPRFGLPRGAVPPGARFDPFGPPGFNLPRPDRNRFAVPDPDHLPPPGYDDMFG